MNTFFMAGVLDDSPIPGFSAMSSAMKESLILLGALLLVSTAVLLWAYWSRRSRRRAARREERNRRRQDLVQNTAKGAAEIQKDVKERSGGRRRQRRPRNPTLAETGGLPPVRSDPSPSSTPPS